MSLDRTEIAAQLRDDINGGAYAAGSKLPSYRQLASLFGAAPNTVGEAVRQLASEGLVHVTPRGRVVVRSDEDWTPSPEERAAFLRSELTEVSGKLREVRGQLDQLEQRVSGLLSKLDD